jgi:hypothetical protein
MFGIPFLSPTLLGAIGIALVASLAGGWAAHKWDGIALSKSQAQTAQIDGAYSQYKAQVAADTAKADALALSQRTALETANNALQAQLADSQRIADAKTKSLQALLASAKPGDTRAIGPIAASYYARLLPAPQAGRTTPPGN